MIYLDEYAMVDTTYLVCASPCDGHLEHDGVYGIALLFDIRGTPKRQFLHYPTSAARDAAFIKLCDCVTQMARQERLLP